jgi:hypothetical protein
LPSAASENIVSINVSNEDGETAVASFPTDEHLPATEKNATLLNLTQRHPYATIDDDPGHHLGCACSPRPETAVRERPSIRPRPEIIFEVAGWMGCIC